MKKMEKVHWIITYVAYAKKIKLMNKSKNKYYNNKWKRQSLFVLNVVLQCVDNVHSHGSAGWDWMKRKIKSNHLMT